MATLTFNGAGNSVNGTTPGAMNGAWSMAGLYRRADTGTNTIMFFHTTGTPGSSGAFVFQTLAAGVGVYVYGWAMSSGPGWMSGTGDWWIIAATRAAGTVTPRFHYKNLTTDSAWQHDVGNSTLSNAASCASGGVKIGAYEGGGGGNDLNGNVALIGFWDGTNLTDGQVESLATNKRTSDWHALAPTSLTELNTLTPTDLEGQVTWTVNGAALTGPDPAGWTFDGTAGPPPPQPPPDVRVLTSTGWVSLHPAFVSGTGAPADEVGIDGAIYLDVTAGEFYGPKVAGEWPATPITIA